MGEAGVISLSRGLQRLTSLTNLHLEFGAYERKTITDVGVDYLRRSLQTLTSLRELSLSFLGFDNLSQSEQRLFE